MTSSAILWSCGPNAGFGIPGLLQAVRLGHVAIANSLGSSLVESPSLIPFLPRIARAWLGEELALPSVATWWCGQEAARLHVAKHRARTESASCHCDRRFGSVGGMTISSESLRDKTPTNSRSY